MFLSTGPACMFTWKCCSRKWILHVLFVYDCSIYNCNVNEHYACVCLHIYVYVYGMHLHCFPACEYKMETNTNVYTSVCIYCCKHFHVNKALLTPLSPFSFPLPSPSFPLYSPSLLLSPSPFSPPSLSAAYRSIATWSVYGMHALALFSCNITV